jgi:hypothetical protein
LLPRSYGSGSSVSGGASGCYSGGFGFCHADGKGYGSAVSPEICELRQKVFLGLKGLGFRESDARRALEAAVERAGGSGQLTAEALLRQALSVLA